MSTRTASGRSRSCRRIPCFSCRFAGATSLCSSLTRGGTSWCCWPTVKRWPGTRSTSDSRRTSGRIMTITIGARQSRLVRAPHGAERSCKGWVQEAALRMLMNNLDPEVAEDPDHLVVYGGSGKAARTWEAFDTIVATLRKLENDETLLVQSGKPVGVIRTHAMAPRVLIANSLLVPKWATWEEFRRLEAMGLTMYGQMTAGSWIYIGTQGILQGTYETFAACGKKHFPPARSA